jgi:predicted small metal-binding protein
MSCRNCGQTISGADEDELVARVQSHIEGHAHERGVDHRVTREQVLARLHHDSPGHTPHRPAHDPAGDDAQP